MKYTILSELCNRGKLHKLVFKPPQDTENTLQNHVQQQRRKAYNLVLKLENTV